MPSIHSPLTHSPHRDDHSHNNYQFKSESSVKNNLISELDETKIKHEPSAPGDQNDNDFDLVGGYKNDKQLDHHDNDLKRELQMGSSKKTMNDVLKLLTNKMRGSSLKDGRKGSTEQDFESKM